MNGKVFRQEMGLPSQVTVSMSNTPMDSSRGLRDWELEKDFHSLESDVSSVIYLAKRGLPVAS
jgi:hypothetical protein